MTRIWPLVLLLAISASVSAGDVYEWTDANGVRHFSDQPPPDRKKAKRVVVKGGVTTNQPVEEPEKAGGEGPALAAAAGYSPDDIKRNCDIARTNLKIAEGRRLPVDAGGRPLDPDAARQRQEQIDKANQQIKLFCSN